MFEALKPYIEAAAKNVPAVLLFVVLLFLLPDCEFFREVNRMRDEFSAYFLFAGLFSFCVLVVHYGGKAWNAFQDGRRRKKMQREALEQAARDAAEKEQKAREEDELRRIKVNALLDRQVQLFNRLSILERRMLLQWYVGKEKNHRQRPTDSSILKLEDLRYIERIGYDTYYLSDWLCDLFDARFEELKAQVFEAASSKQTPATSSEDKHLDAVIARKYAEGDPETIRKLSIFDP